MSEVKLKPIDKYSKEPILVHAGHYGVLLGIGKEPPKVDCRVIAEDLYQFKQEALKEAEEIIQTLQAYGMIHPVEGVRYPEGSHRDFIKKAQDWLYKYRK